MRTLEEAVATYEQYVLDAKQEKLNETYKYYSQLVAWLRELQDRRKAPEIVTCYECEHYIPVSNSWGKCSVHSSLTEKQRTCQSCDYCSWAERRTE